MLTKFSGLLSVLLVLALICAQVSEGTLIISEDVAKNEQLSLTNSHNVSQISAHEIFIAENKDNNATYEDQESFQDQDNIHHYSRCNELDMEFYGRNFCLLNFTEDMKEVEGKWCNWDEVFSAYNTLTTCMETCAMVLHCYYPNAVVQDLFMEVHKGYFSQCETEEDDLPDAPARVVLVLTLLPVSVIPILVYMVIWKSSVID